MPVIGNQPGRLLQTIVENVGVAVAVLDSEGKIVFANHTALTMFGMIEPSSSVHLKEVVRGFQFKDRLGREIPIEKSAVLRTLAGEDVKPQDIRAIFPNGETKWLHTTTHKFSVLGLAGVLLIVADETKEVELRRAAAQLERMDACGSIAVGLAHNFNNVLGTITINAELALSEEGVMGTTRSRLEQIRNASWNAAGLVKRLLLLSRYREMQIRPVQINSVIKDVLVLVRPILKNKVQLNIELREGLPEIEADPTEIEQALVNLIVNAKDAMPNGGDLMIATDLAGSVAGEAGTRGSAQPFVVITVADTGVGIREEIRDRIFEPFFTTKTAEQGTGLGLSSAYGIVQQHQGTIEVWSAPGKGTKFTIRLPLKRTVVEADEGGMSSAA